MEDYDKLFKVVLVGRAGVGKSGCMYRYHKNEFNTESKSTIGVEFITKLISINDTVVKVQLWDTAGQERYRAITPAYYRGCVGVIIVYDISNKESFLDIDRLHKEVIDNTSKSLCNSILLLGNKKDLESRRKVSEMEGIEYAKSHSMLFSEVSALTGENIDLSINKLINNIYQHTPKYDDIIPPTSNVIPLNNLETSSKFSWC